MLSAVGCVLFRLCRYAEIPQCIVERCFLVGRFLAAADNQGARYAVFACRKLFAVASRYDHRAGRYIPFVGDRFRPRHVDDVGRTRDDGVRAQDRFAADVRSFDNNATRADETMVFDDDRCRLYGFQHAADADTARADGRCARFARTSRPLPTCRPSCPCRHRRRY